MTERKEKRGSTEMVDLEMYLTTGEKNPSSSYVSVHVMKYRLPKPVWRGKILFGLYVQMNLQIIIEGIQDRNSIRNLETAVKVVAREEC